ncbi:MAG: D-aminoacyl-tRNA deacylase [Bacillota bacterium]|nr:D-aminoacyl-tRNA deacylase [Bacillota bacterium]
MRAVVQKAAFSNVVVEGEQKAQIDRGLMVLLAVKKGDSQQEAEYIVDKIINLRIFEDEDGKMNRSLLDVEGELLMVSQFTLYGDVRKGRRPGFSDAEEPDAALKLFNYAVDYARAKVIKVETGVFGANMMVRIDNEGPCTILLDSEKNF